ncbi:hypothetical protein K227x_40070 [Rubripirellula lacrimiformis]|uniref:Uncharacterized protein n=1 Tax=Rubripirellula lacrimiformis TaxID=1930273 RepID=A0A517NEQ2_9BACT|nr:hypothetical protein K227x_40070 [Rubripirellula lacrimiformis]
MCIAKPRGHRPARFRETRGSLSTRLNEHLAKRATGSTTLVALDQIQQGQVVSRTFVLFLFIVQIGLLRQ